jgi:hypothetical protein
MKAGEQKAALLASMEGAPVTRAASCLRKYLRGERTTQREAILGKCADCMAYFVDGRYGCENEACPLYPWMPFLGRRSGAAGPSTDVSTVEGR